MRLTLADAGDSIEDANFEEGMAEAQLLRLYTFIEWVKEVLNVDSTAIEQETNTFATISEDSTLVRSAANGIKDKFSQFSPNDECIDEQNGNYRIDANYNYYDHVFQSEMNRAIKLTEESYEKMLYKDVLKYGFFELQIARDNYRELCSESERMNLGLIKQFIEIQSILLAPICPHICDYVYQLLHPGTTIMTAQWPTVGQIDESLIDSCKYLMSTAHDFRLRIKSYKTQQTNEKSKNIKVFQSQSSPTHATIFVARTYPSRETFIVNELKELFIMHKWSLPDNKQLANHFKNRPEIDKKYQKKLMPFVIHLKELLEKNGNISALDRHLSFDEYEVLQLNQEYLRRTLGVEQIEIRSTDENEIDAMILLNHIDDISPGKPFIHFRYQGSVPKHVFNDQELSPGDLCETTS